MAFKITLRNNENADTIHAVVRMDSKTHKALKQFMHCTDQIAIRFPQGIALYWRGCGWYRLEAMNSYKAIERIAFAVKIIKRFLLEEQRKVEEEIKKYQPIMLNPGLKVATFSNAHSEGEFGYLGKAQPQERTPVPQHKLNALVAKFARPQRT